jgi:hypothetical protein
MFNRREFGLLASGLVLPRRLLAGAPRAKSTPGTERKFLFVFNDGGWDTGHVFTPYWSIDGAFTEEAAAPSTANGINFVDHPERPSVRQFFETWGPQTALINGMEVQSVTHQRCRELVLTGQGALADDWASLLAGKSVNDLLLPHVVVDGPAFSSRYTSGVVRVGDAGQLPALLSGDALRQSAVSLDLLTESAELKADQFVAQRASARGDDFGASYSQALERIEDLRAWDDLDLSVDDLDCERDLVRDAALAFDLFELGLSRTAMLRYRGWCAEGWDTHQGLEKQSKNFGDLFDYLNTIMAELAGRVSHTGNPLSDEVTIVIFSEMGREPRLNSWGGRDHWTFTSALLVGSGIQGGQTIGALDEYGQGQAIDLGTGALSATGTSLLPEHLGATLLKLGDVDPSEFLDAPQSIDAVLS